MKQLVNCWNAKGELSRSYANQQPSHQAMEGSEAIPEVGVRAKRRGNASHPERVKI